MLRLGLKIVWKSQLHKAETFTSEEVALVVALKLGGGCVKRNPVTKYMHISPDGRISHIIYKILKTLNPDFEVNFYCANARFLSVIICRSLVRDNTAE